MPWAGGRPRCLSSRARAPAACPRTARPPGNRISDARADRAADCGKPVLKSSSSSRQNTVSGPTCTPPTLALVTHSSSSSPSPAAFSCVPVTSAGALHPPQPWVAMHGQPAPPVSRPERQQHLGASEQHGSLTRCSWSRTLILFLHDCYWGEVHGGVFGTGQVLACPCRDLLFLGETTTWRSVERCSSRSRTSRVRAASACTVTSSRSGGHVSWPLVRWSASATQDRRCTRRLRSQPAQTHPTASPHGLSDRPHGAKPQAHCTSRHHSEAGSAACPTRITSRRGPDLHSIPTITAGIRAPAVDRISSRPRPVPIPHEQLSLARRPS